MMSSSVTTVATPGATGGTTLAGPWTTLRRRARAMAGSAPNSNAQCAGDPAPATGKRTKSTSDAHGSSARSGGAVLLRNAVMRVPGSARRIAGISSLA